MSEEKVFDSYEVEANGLHATIRIVDKGDFVPIYQIEVTGLGEATKLLLISLRQELLSMVPIDLTKIEDAEYMEGLKERYKQASSIIIARYLPGTNEETKNLLTSYIINMMLGLGDLEIPLSDDGLEEIVINSSKEPVWVFHRKYGWCKTNLIIPSENQIYEYSEQIGRRVGRQITNLSPLMDAQLPDGSRVNATLYPVSQSGNTITIRKFSKNPWTMPALVKNKTISKEIASLIWLCVQNEISILISGGTASGKTSFLNAMSIFMPANRRIISIEETRELTLPSFLHWLPMLTRQPNPEGKGEVRLYDLMINALRQRPDVLLVGEIRTKPDAETLFEAIHTGHSVYGTIHADNAQDTIVRMTNPPIEIPKLVINAIGGILSMFRHRRLGIRRVLEFSEILSSGDVNVIYRWNMRNDSFAQVSQMTRMIETLTLYAGLTQREIELEMEEKGRILDWMVRNNVLDVDLCGYVIANYYKNKEKILDLVNNDVSVTKETLSKL
ncbi:MAG: ATPase, T2SS/T4P/T4SS family [Candidatus Micrarchaeaceae archaeon]